MLMYSRAVHKYALMIVLLMISKLNYSQTFNWAKSFGGTSAEQSRSMTIDASGNVYTAGYFQGTIDLDPGAATVSATAVGSNDAFLVKQDASGNFLWGKTWGSANADASLAVAVDASGNVYVGGVFSGTTDFDPGAGTTSVAATTSDAFISKFNAAGVFQWVKTWGGTGNDQVFAIALDASANIYVTGQFVGSVDLDPGAATVTFTAASGASGTDTDLYLTKLNSSGTYQWTKTWGAATGDDHGYAVTVDASGYIYTTGDFLGTVDFDPSTTATANLTSVGAGDVFVSKLDGSGNYVWAKAWGGTTADRGNCIAVDASGNVYTAGTFLGTTDFDPGAATVSVTPAGSADVFVSKLNASGNYVWAKTWGGTAADFCWGLAIAAGGYIVTTGGFSATVDFDPGAGAASVTSAGGYDAYISVLNTSGTFKWVQTWGSTSNEVGYGVKVTSAGAIYSAGYYTGTVDFDPGTGSTSFTAAGSFDVYVNKFSDATLPLTWLAVTGRLGNEHQALISWLVEEISVQEYSIEKSTDGGATYSSVGVVAGKGDGKHNYTFAESNALTGTAWYRIKQTDWNGSYTYSTVVKVTASEAPVASVKVFPVPVTSQFTIQVNSNKYLNTKATLYNASGSVQKVIFISDYNTLVDAAELLPGLYTLKLADGNSVKIVR